MQKPHSKILKIGNLPELIAVSSDRTIFVKRFANITEDIGIRYSSGLYQNLHAPENNKRLI
jgi:hypothetical protein